VLIAGGRHYCVWITDGYSYDDCQNDDAELLDPSHPLSKSTLLVSQGRPTTTLLSDGRVLVAGGGRYIEDAAPIPEAPEIFDPRTEKFTPVGPMRTPRFETTAIKIADGRVLFFGGMDPTKGTIEAFDPDSGTFQVIAERFPNITNFSATLLNDGRILVAGGSSNSRQEISAATWLLTP
jgi:hypothetical protein